MIDETGTKGAVAGMEKGYSATLNSLRPTGRLQDNHSSMRAKGCFVGE